MRGQLEPAESAVAEQAAYMTEVCQCCLIMSKRVGEGSGEGSGEVRWGKGVGKGVGR